MTELREFDEPASYSTRVMIMLATLAGMRVSEISRVRGEDLDLGAPSIRVVGKGRKTRTVPLHPLLVAIAATMPARGYWFPANNTRPGEHVRSKSVSQSTGRSGPRDRANRVSCREADTQEGRSARRAGPAHRVADDLRCGSVAAIPQEKPSRGQAAQQVRPNLRRA